MDSAFWVADKILNINIISPNLFLKNVNSEKPLGVTHFHNHFNVYFFTVSNL